MLLAVLFGGLMLAVGLFMIGILLSGRMLDYKCPESADGPTPERSTTDTCRRASGGPVESSPS
jgi:hypothetical protein